MEKKIVFTARNKSSIFSLFLFLILGCEGPDALVNFPPTDYDITASTANTMKEKFATLFPNSPQSGIFTKTAMQEIIDRDEVSGARYYYAIKDGGTIVMMVGTKENGNQHDDLVHNTIISSTGENLSYDAASRFAEAYRAQNPDNRRGGFFSRSAIWAIMYDYHNQADCKGISFYHGINENDEPQLIFRGSHSATLNEDIEGGRIIDMSLPCPSACGNTNGLNAM